MKRKIKLIKIFLLCFFIGGCLEVTEVPKTILGTSTLNLENARTNAKVRIFNSDYKTCYEKTKLVLKKIHAYIYLHSYKKQRIVAMNLPGFAVNTTPVGIFFTEIDSNSTKIEISAGNPYLLETIPEMIFAELDKELSTNSSQ